MTNSAAFAHVKDQLFFYKCIEENKYSTQCYIEGEQGTHGLDYVDGVFASISGVAIVAGRKVIDRSVEVMKWQFTNYLAWFNFNTLNWEYEAYHDQRINDVGVALGEHGDV